MFRLWGKIWKDNHLLKDTVICDDSEDTRTHKIFRGLESICYEMDLGNPIWLESTVRHFKKHGNAPEGFSETVYLCNPGCCCWHK